MRQSSIRHLRALAVLLLITSCGGSSTKPSSATNDTCNAALADYVYDPARLQVVAACRTVTGIVANLHSNPDGDFDIRITPDPPYADLINDANRTRLGNHLQVEAICQAPPSYDIAKTTCGGFSGNVVIPQVGQHISATGRYVLDTNYGWMELHPVSVIRVIP
jgi:hypothetical protein